MTATYQNNVKKVKQLLAKSISERMFYDPRAYPYHEEEFLHTFLKYGLDPWKDSYASPLVHINLYQVTTAKQINSLPFFLVRDGLFTLLDFFHRLPNPKLAPGIMFIHNSLKDYVPPIWRAKVIYYEFEYRNLETNVFQQKNKEVFIKANVTQGIFDYDLAMKKVLELKKLKFNKFNFLFFNRSNVFLAKEWDSDYLTIEYVRTQAKFINFLEKEKIDYEFLTWKEFFHIQGAHQFSCLDLNYKEKHYIDDFTNYHFLKKGMTPLNLSSMKGHESDLYVPITSFHGIRILGQAPTINSAKGDEIFKNLKLMNVSSEKCDYGAFQMFNEVSEKKLNSACLKVFN
jgi:hypothetical protein